MANRRDIGVFIIGLLVGATGVKPLTHLVYWILLVFTGIGFYNIGAHNYKNEIQNWKKEQKENLNATNDFDRSSVGNQSSQ